MGKKKEAAKLAERQARIEAELAARAAAKKAAKKSKGKKKAKPVEVPAVSELEAQVIADAKAERKAKSAKSKTIEAADAVLAGDSSEGAILAAKTAKAAAAEAGNDETDEEIKARVLAKRVARAAETAPLGGTTSTPEGLDAIIDPTPAKIEKAKKAVAKAREAIASIVETDNGREFVVAPLGHSDDDFERVALPGDYVMPDVATATVDGDLDLEGSPTLVERVVEEFAKPSEAPKGDFEQNGNGQYRVRRPSDGKIVGYTRVTTYIASLEDRTMIEKWKLRMLLEGVAVNDHPDDNGRIDEPVVATMRDLIHRRDVAIAKARKADRKGKLTPGELATYVDGAWSEFKKAVNDLAEELLEAGGAHEKRTKGTDIHALTELYDREGIDAVGDLLTEGKITPQDLADVEAYADAMKRAGIRVIDIERPVVNHELKVAGTLDRTALVKLPGAQRASKMVVDIKTGRIDLGAGKLAQQLELYASSRGYDLDTHEEEDLKLSRTKAVVVHLPAGTGTCFIYPVDLTLGRKGNRLSGEVRAWRNEGKRAVDFDTDLAGSMRG